MRRPQDPAAHLEDVGRGLGAEDLPARIGLHRGPTALAIAGILEAPHMHDLVDDTAIGGEPADQMAEMGDL